MSFRFDRNADLATKQRVVRWALWRTRGNVTKAAALIGAHRNTVRAIKVEMERWAKETLARGTS